MDALIHRASIGLLNLAVSFLWHRDVFHVWPSSASNGRRLETGCAEVVLLVATAPVVTAGEQLWLREETRGLTGVSEEKKDLTAPAHGCRRH